MRTIQEYFKEANKDELIRYYIYEHPLKIQSEEDVYPEDVFKKYYDTIDKLVERIRNSTIKSSEKQMVFLTHHSVDMLGNEDDIYHSLFEIDEVLKNDTPTSYSFIMTDLEEAIGYYVADTYLTQRNIIELLSFFLFEISFFGYEQEYLEEEREELAKRSEEVKSGELKTISSEEFWEKVEKDTGWTREVRNKEEEEAYNTLMKQVGEYNNTALLAEIKNFRKVYDEENSNII